MIYNSTKVMPYVYMLEHKITGQFYIGYRGSKRQTLPSNEDIHKYQSSSKLVKEIGFSNFIIMIIAEFFDKISAYDFEQELIFNTINNPLSLNKACHYYNKKRFIVREYETGRKFSQSHKENISRNHHDVSGSKNPFYNKKHSFESRLKIAARDYSTVSGRNNKHARKLMINGKIFFTVREAGKYFSINENTLRDYLKNRTRLNNKIWQANYLLH